MKKFSQMGGRSDTVWLLIYVSELIGSMIWTGSNDFIVIDARDWIVSGGNAYLIWAREVCRILSEGLIRKILFSVWMVRRQIHSWNVKKALKPFGSSEVSWKLRTIMKLLKHSESSWTINQSSSTILNSSQTTQTSMNLWPSPSPTYFLSYHQTRLRLSAP